MNLNDLLSGKDIEPQQVLVLRLRSATTSNPRQGSLARSEGRFSKHFDRDGNPSLVLHAANQDRLENWHLLEEPAGLR
jgi:hypothetical protein